MPTDAPNIASFGQKLVCRFCYRDRVLVLAQRQVVVRRPGEGLATCVPTRRMSCQINVTCKTVLFGCISISSISISTIPQRLLIVQRPAKGPASCVPTLRMSCQINGHLQNPSFLTFLKSVPYIKWYNDVQFSGLGLLGKPL